MRKKKGVSLTKLLPKLHPSDCLFCGCFPIDISLLSFRMISQRECPSWFEVTVDMSCQWDGCHNVAAVEKMQSNKQTGPQ